MFYVVRTLGIFTHCTHVNNVPAIFVSTVAMEQDGVFSPIIDFCSPLVYPASKATATLSLKFMDVKTKVRVVQRLSFFFFFYYEWLSSVSIPAPQSKK